MLTELRMENFKCFGAETIVPCGRLNLLTGINSKGKSTTLQSLLLLQQSLDRTLASVPILDRIDLNGRNVRLGSFREIQNRHIPNSTPVGLGFEFTEDFGVTVSQLALWQSDSTERWAGIASIDVKWFAKSGAKGRLSGHGGGPLYKTLDFAPGRDGRPAVDELAHRSRLQQLGSIHYVSADRLGPQEYFPWSSSLGFLSVGGRGERTPEVLYRAEQEQQQVRDAMLRGENESESHTVPDQASAWLSFVFDGGAVRVDAGSGVILTVEMNADGSPTYFRSVHLGFGYSYVLPILVAGLVALPGEILIVENPEAHLHPLAQSRIGQFLAQVAASGVQVFVESHSEHILNAFRLAVREQRIPAQDLVVLYFRRNAQDPILRVPIEADGRVTEWPDGFFDQRTRDFLRLFGE